MKYYKFQTRKPRRTYLKFIFLILLLGLAWGLWQFGPFRGLDTKKIVENSVLKEKTFERMPQEIKNGQLTAWLIEDHTVPIISIQFLFERAGYAYDEQGQEGRAVLASEMMLFGAGKNNRFEFQELLELNGIRLGFEALRDDFGGYLITPSYHKKTAFALLKDVLTEPNWEDKDFEVVKNQVLAALKMQKEQPEDELSLAFNEVLYKNHPYGRNPLGKAEDIKNLKLSQVKAFLKSNLAQDNLMIGIAGDITAEETKAVLAQIFANLNAESEVQPLEPPVVDFTPQTTHIERDTAQSIGRFAALGAERTAPDFYALYIANHILGGSGLTSRLSLKAREDKGLTYGIGTYLSTSENTPLIIGYFSATPENYAKAAEILRQEWQNFAQKGATEEELQAARDYLLASFNLRFSSIDDIAQMLLGMQKYNLGLDFLQKRNTYVKNVRLKDIRRAAKKYFKSLPLEVNIGIKE